MDLDSYFLLVFSHFSATSLEKASPLAEGYLRHRSVPSCTNSTVSVVKMTPLSFLPGAKITKYLGIINMFFIRETTSLREVSCVAGIHFMSGTNFLVKNQRFELKCGTAREENLCHLWEGAKCRASSIVLLLSWSTQSCLCLALLTIAIAIELDRTLNQ